MAGIGESLRSTRERRGLSIDQVALDTRISPRFLEALEAEQFAELPAPVYVRGFLRSYANYLRIEPEPLLEQLVNGDSAYAVAGAAAVNGNGHRSGAKKDPFQRTAQGSAAATPGILEPGLRKPDPPTEDDTWAPEPLAPFAPPHIDHGYVPGSDLLEAPEHQPVVIRERAYSGRSRGVLAERPPSPGEPSISRRVLLFGGGVLAVLAFLLLAVLVTRDSDDGSTKAAASNPGAGATPGTVISLTSRTAGPSVSASASASTTAPAESVTAAGATTAASQTTTANANPTTTAGTTVSATTTPPATTNTPAPTATPVPTATPTSVPTVVVPPHPSTISACDLTKEAEKCGSASVRVICYPPFGEADPRGYNDNYFADVTGSYPLQPGWRETTVSAPVSIGPVINVGQHGCR